MISIGKIGANVSKKDYPSAISDTMDFFVGKISSSRAKFAILGGKFYKNICFRAFDDFAEKSSRAVGIKYDKKKFWKDVYNQMSLSQQSFFSWMGGAEND